MKRSVSISVYNKDGDILTVTNRRFGGFTLPGGKVDPEDRDTEVAAIRELYEETGLKPRALKYLGCSLFKNPMWTDADEYLVSHFEAIIDDPQPRQVEEGTTPVWKSPCTLLNDKGSIFHNHYARISELGVVKHGG